MRSLFQHRDDAIGPVDANLTHAIVDLGQIHVAFGLKAGAQIVVFNRHCGIWVVNAVEAPSGQPFLGEGTLPRCDDILGIVLAGGDVDLVENVQKLA